MIGSREQNLFGLPVERDILFSNHKGNALTFLDFSIC
jgi:hypothetical protein